MRSSTFRFRPLTLCLPHGTNTSLFVRASYACLLLFVLSFFPRPVSAAQNSTASGRLLTRAEGMSIVDAISQNQKPARGRRTKLDCSHLVNAIYNRAGFSYSYASSADLYRGLPNFARVNKPQPGDLIVWRGHVGLVVDPREHLFFSSLRSGLETEDYTSPYWRRRGSPRFYRYVVSNSDPVLTARQSSPRSESSGQYKTVSVNQLSRNERDQDQESEPTRSRDSFNTPSATGNSASQQNADIDEYSSASPVISFGTSHDKPTVKQITEAITQWRQSRLSGLHAGSLLHTRSTVIIFNQFQVEHAEYKGKQGVAYVTLNSDGSLTSGVLNKEVRHIEQKWDLRRVKTGWTLTPPPEIIYVPRPVAVRIFAQQLARLAGAAEAEIADSTSSEEGQLASLLSGLLNK